MALTSYKTWTAVTVTVADLNEQIRDNGNYLLSVRPQPCGRLTLTTATPITTSDVTGATTLYYTPYLGNSIELYSGSVWLNHVFTELSITLATLTANLPYDAFVYSNAGAATLELTAWTNATTRATALTLQDGIQVKSGATTRRYVGTVRINSTGGQCDDTLTSRRLWNEYHAMPCPVRKLETTDSWTYSTATLRQANGAATNQVDILAGTAGRPLSVRVVATFSNSNANIFAGVSIGEDSTSASHASVICANGHSDATATKYTSVFSVLDLCPAVGGHYYAWLEYSVATPTTTWYGDDAAGAGGVRSGITGMWWH